MTRIKTFVLASAVALSVSLPAAAQFVSSELKVDTVKSVLDNARDDQIVALEGNIVKRIGNEKYLFRDATGEMRVEIDDEVFAGQRVDEKTKIRIVGEYEKDLFIDFDDEQLDVKRLTIIR